MTNEQYSSIKRELLLMQCDIERVQNNLRDSINELAGLYNDLADYWNKVIDIVNEQSKSGTLNQ